MSMATGLGPCTRLQTRACSKNGTAPESGRDWEMDLTMLRKIFALCAATLACLAVSATAGAVSLINENLVGTWALDNDQCGQEKSELIVFRKTGVVESIRGGRVEAVGFWKLDNDAIQMSVLAPPAAFSEKLKDGEVLRRLSLARIGRPDLSHLL